MHKLASLIENELKAQEICAVYNSELERVWPKTISAEKRKKEIKRFADKLELAVTFYDVGLCAVFEKPQRSSQSRGLMLSARLPKRVKRKRCDS